MRYTVVPKLKERNGPGRRYKREAGPFYIFLQNIYYVCQVPNFPRKEIFLTFLNFLSNIT